MWRSFARGMPVVVVMAACTGAPETATTAPVVPVEPTTTVAERPTTTTDPPPVTTTIPPGGETPDAAVFLAAVDRGLEGTVYEGEAFRDPESFIATGLLFCDLLTTGLTVDEVLTAYISALSAQSPDGSITDEDLVLGGVVLGAAMGVLCPDVADATGSEGAIPAV